MLNIFDTKFIQSLTAEIAVQLKAGNTVTRGTVLAGLGHDPSPDLELAVSLALRLGQIPEYRLCQKVGIRPAGVVPKRKQVATDKATRAPRKSRNTKKNALTEETVLSSGADTTKDTSVENVVAESI